MRKNGPNTLLQRSALVLLLVTAWCVFDASAQTIEVIEPTGQRVTDRADILTDGEEQSLSRKLSTYEDSTSTQIVIVTVPTLDDVAPVDYATELGRRWEVGQQGQDNGVVVLVSRDDREVFIATGYGLEGAIPDVIANRIVEDVIVPNFRQGQFYAGLSRAVDHLIAAAQGEFTAEQVDRPQRRGERALDGGSIFILMILAYFVINGIRHGRRGGGDGGKRYRRRRGGPPLIIWGGGFGGHRGGGGGFGGFGGGGGFGGFGGGGGSFGGGGAGGSW